jgi:hypothetical protein
MRNAAVLPQDERLNETLGPSRNNEILIDNNSYRNPGRPYLTEYCADMADFRQCWGGWDASSPQKIADNRDSRHRGCGIVVILHDELE